MSIYRKVALDRLSSPEQLDLLLEVTDSRGWIALAALGAILAAAIAWSFVGTIPTRVSGLGILVMKGGISSVSALATGQLLELRVAPGAEVKKGQTIARLGLPELETALKNARANLAALEAEHAQRATFGSEETRLQSDALGHERSVEDDVIRQSRQRAAAFAARLASQKKLLDEGLVTEQVVQGTRDSLRQAESDAARARGSIKDLSLKWAELRHRIEQENTERLQRIDALRRGVADIDQKIQEDELVRSPSDGRVIEVRAAVGSLVSAGTPVITLEVAADLGRGSGTARASSGGGRLEAIVYVPGSDGKKVHEAMAAEVAPSTVKTEEYGAMRARVTSVSEFPSTQQAMLADLGNQDLVTTFMRAIDTPIQVRVDLTPSADTPSGYAWTSPKGPPSLVQAGTLCHVSVLVQKRAPIRLVLPMLRETFGL